MQKIQSVIRINPSVAPTGWTVNMIVAIRLLLMTNLTPFLFASHAWRSTDIGPAGFSARSFTNAALPSLTSRSGRTVAWCRCRSGVNINRSLLRSVNPPGRCRRSRTPAGIDTYGTVIKVQVQTGIVGVEYIRKVWSQIGLTLKSRISVIGMLIMNKAVPQAASIRFTFIQALWVDGKIVSIAWSNALSTVFHRFFKLIIIHLVLCLYMEPQT